MQQAGLPISPGDVLAGKYVVERQLGRGGMGFVVAARHMELGETFAIKFLLPEALQSSSAIERFLREARAAAKLKGEHVARVHDVGRLDNGAPFMVMEHLAGEDLGQLMKRRGRLPPDEAAVYVLQACEAIDEAHRAGIVHRDLKPGNLFVTRRANGTVCVKVLDFGISKQLTGAEPTKTGSVYGTPAYMAPEQMQGAPDLDGRVDVWSLGVVLYRLLTGVTPFLGKNDFETVTRVLETEPAPPSRLCPELPAALDAIVLGCLAKSPAARTAGVTDLAAQLAALGFTAEPAPVPSRASMVSIAMPPVGAPSARPLPVVTPPAPRPLSVPPPPPSSPMSAPLASPGSASSSTSTPLPSFPLPVAPAESEASTATLPWSRTGTQPRTSPGSVNTGARIVIVVLTILATIITALAISAALGSRSDAPASGDSAATAATAAVSAVSAVLPSADVPPASPSSTATEVPSAEPSATASTAQSGKPKAPKTPRPPATHRPIF